MKTPATSMLRVFFFASLLACSVSGLKGQSLIANGTFDGASTFANLYDGVDASGNLKVFPARGPVYLSGDKADYVNFSPSVSFTDVNADGLPDLVAASPMGFLYCYMNVGKTNAPAFKSGRLIQTYLGNCTRIHAVDWNGDRQPDILFGNMSGEVFLLPNRGFDAERQMPKWVESMSKPRWFPPADNMKVSGNSKRSGWASYEYDPVQRGYEAQCITDDKGPIRVGFYSAPVYADWNNDGKPDLIVGEGSYSANSVRIWLNTGTSGSPSFRSDAKFYLAFGEGKEQLTPSVYDWNSDGLMDLVVGDRDGEIGLYLGTKESIADPKSIKTVALTKKITLGGNEKISSLVCVYPCDYNGDGIPDLLYGTKDGSILVAIGKGDKKDPELGRGTFLTGEDTAKDFPQATSWKDEDWNFAESRGLPYRGNAPIAEVVTLPSDQLPFKDGPTHALHLSWFEKFCGWCYLYYNPYWTDKKGLPAGFTIGNIEGVYNLAIPINFLLDKSYELSFWHRASDMRIFYVVDYTEVWKDPNKKGSPYDYAWHTSKNREGVTSSPVTWAQYRKTMKLEAREPIQHLKEQGGFVSFYFIGKGDAWLYDVKLVDTGAAAAPSGK